MLHRARWALVGLLLAGACGKDDAAVPGYVDPCTTSMGAVLGCPAGGQLLPEDPHQAIIEACDKLVQCGILAGDRRQGQSASHWLDYVWCVNKLTDPGSHPCSSDRDFTASDVEEATNCILQTPCAALGLSLDEKLASGADRSGLDQFTCTNEATVRTATVCDQGLLSY